MKYQNLIADHDRIDEAARALLGVLRISDTSHADVAYRLLDLATLVSEHLAIEASILIAIRGRDPAAPWKTTFERGLPALEALKSDWSRFLGEWNAEAIANDLPQFREEAETLLPRLRERNQRETQDLYATALQTGVITLR